MSAQTVLRRALPAGLPGAIAAFAAIALIAAGTAPPDARATTAEAVTAPPDAHAITAEAAAAQEPERLPVAGPPSGPTSVTAAVRSVATVARSLAASGDFRGNGRSHVALLGDPSSDLSLRISLLERDAAGESFSESLWYASGPGSFDLSRAKLAVADVTGDGKDDLVVLYGDGATSVRLLVFRSTGTAFDYTGDAGWWRSEGYSWSRVHALLGGTFSGAGRAGLLSVYQYDDFQMRVHYFESTGSSFAYTGNQGVYDSGAGQYDARRARFAVGLFTRPSGPHQIAALYQYPNFRVRLHVFDPSPSGLVALNGWAGLYDSGDGQYDLSRAQLAAADVNGDGMSDVLALYGYGDGSARVHVFDAASGFRPAGGFAGAATLAPGLTCSGASGLLVGDWDGDRRADAAALTFVAGAGTRASLLHNTGAAFRLSPPPGEVRCDRWPLAGLPTNGASTGRRPLYVKIDNAPAARPHYGIARADIVFEWLVEGMTTRLAALFHSADPDVLGAVRSGRHTDRAIVPAFRGVLVYSGAAGEETAGFSYDHTVGRYIDLNAGYYGWSYRVGFRGAPYNMFTSGARIREAARLAGGGDDVSVPPWEFLSSASSDAEAGGLAGSAAATDLTIPYQPAAFPVRYRYDPATRTYARWQAGVREIDAASGEPVAARNVVVILTDVWLTERYGVDAAGSPKVDMRLVGTAPALIFRDGRRQEATWTRPDIVDPFTFTNRAGEKILLAAGQTWIHVIPREWRVPSN